MALTLVSTDKLISLLHLENDIDSYPALLVLIDSVHAKFESHTRRKFSLDDYIETTRQRSSTAMVGLNALPVDVVNSVTVDGIATSDYEITDYGIEFRRKLKGWIVVDYSGGIEEAAGDLERAALLQISYEYQNHDHMGAESVSNEGGSVQRPALGLLKEVSSLLKSYKHPLNGIL